MMRILVVSLLSMASLLCFVFTWLENARYTRQLDAIGRSYGCKRWLHETNNSYYKRLQARIGFR